MNAEVLEIIWLVIMIATYILLIVSNLLKDKLLDKQGAFIDELIKDLEQAEAKGISEKIAKKLDNMDVEEMLRMGLIHVTMTQDQVDEAKKKAVKKTKVKTVKKNEKTKSA